MVEVGSMEIVGIYKDAGLFASLEGTKTRIKESVNQAKILKEETHLLQKVAQEAAASFGEIAIESKEVEKLKETIEEAIPDVKDIIIKTKVEGIEEVEDLKEIYEEAAASFGSFVVGVEGTEEVEELKRIYEEAAVAAQNFGGLQFGGLVDELKDVENKTKTVSVSMKRLKAVVLTAGVAMAGLALGFLSMLKNAISSSPYLIGALTRIKTDLMLMGWALTKHLKPAFDLLADAIHALRKGDWEFFKTKAKEAWDYFIGIVKGAWGWIKEHGPEWLSNIMQTLEDMASRIVGFDWAGKGLWEGFKNVIKTVWDEVIDPLLPEWLSDLISALGTWIDENGETIAETLNMMWQLITWSDVGVEMMQGIWQGIKDWKAQKNTEWNRWWYNVGFGWADRLVEGFKAAFRLPTVGSYASGTDYPGRAIGSAVIASTGLYEVHAGEEIIPANSNRQTNRNPETNIVLDFAGAEINLSSGIELDSFAQVVSQKIADNQSWGAY
jgi:hypothetical protein